MKKMDDELLEQVGGGYNVDDLSEEELAELEKWGGIYIEMQMKKNAGEATYTKEERLAIINKINELDAQYKQKYGS